MDVLKDAVLYASKLTINSIFKGKIKNSSFLIISNNSFAQDEQFHLCLSAFQKKEHYLAQINFVQNDQMKKSEKGKNECC